MISFLITPSMFTNIEGMLPSKRAETACVLTVCGVAEAKRAAYFLASLAFPELLSFLSLSRRELSPWERGCFELSFWFFFRVQRRNLGLLLAWSGIPWQNCQCPHIRNSTITNLRNPSGCGF